MRRPPKGPSAADARVGSLQAAPANPQLGGEGPQANMDAEGNVDFDPLVSSILGFDDGALVARFHDQGVRRPVWLGFLRRVLVEEAATAFAEGLVVWASASGTHQGKRDRVAMFRRGFAQFLNQRAGPAGAASEEDAQRSEIVDAERKWDLTGTFAQGSNRPESQKLSLADLTPELLGEFERWLSEHHRTGPVQGKTRMMALESVVRRLWLMPRWKERVDPGLDFGSSTRRTVGKGPRSTRNKVLAAPDYDALWLAASRKSKRLVALHERRKAALAAALAASATAVPPTHDPVALAAWMTRAYREEIPPAHKYAGKGIKDRIPSALWERARRILMPRTDELLPAVIILMTVFALNVDVVKGFRHRTDYRIGTSVGRRRLFVSPLKTRPKPKRQRNNVVATEDLDNPARVIRFVEERTAFIRERIGAPHSRMLFLFLMVGGANSFLSTGTTLSRAVQKFGKTHKIPALQLKKLRSSSLDRIHLLTGGDLLKVRDVANHGSIQTTFRDYQTDAIAQRDVESLGNAMLQNDRFVASAGVIRPWLVAPELDRGSATPGYACLDPLRSEIPGEEDGVLCKAYGRCPICPLSALQMTPRAYAYLDALATRIDEALTVDEVVTGPEWIGRWSIVRKSLARQMRLYPDEIIAAAAGETISTLPPLE